MTRAITRTTWAFFDSLGTGKTYYFDGDEVRVAGGFLVTPDGRLWKMVVGRSIREATEADGQPRTPPALAWEKE